MSDRFGSIPIEPAQPGTNPKSRPTKKARQRKKSAEPTAIGKSPKSPRDKRTGVVPKTLATVLITASIFGAYLAAGFWGVPKYISTTLATKLQEQVGMLVDFEQVSFNPFSFILDISGVAVHTGVVHNGNETRRPILTASSFTADLAPLQLLRGEFVTTSLAVDNLDLQLIRHEDGNYNFSHLTTKRDFKATEEILDFSDLPFRFSLNNISAKNSRIVFEDKPKKGTHIIEEIDLTLPTLSNFSFAAKEYIHPSFKAVVNGSPIEMTGQAIIAGDGSSAMQTNLECNFDNLDLPLYLAYLPLQLPFDITKGKADAVLNFTFSPTAKEHNLQVNFSLQAKDTVVIGKNESFSLEVPASKLEGGIQPITGDTHLKNIVLRQPELRLKSSINVEDVVAVLDPANRAQVTVPATQSSRIPKLDIDLLLADSGSLVLPSDSKKSQAETWTNIQVSLKDYTSTPENRENDPAPTFRLVAEKAKKQGSLKWQGKLNHNNLPDGQLQLTGLDASRLFAFLDLKNFGTQTGIADTQAHISFARGVDPEDKPRLHINDATITLRNFSAKQGKTVWFASPDTKIAGFSKEGNRTSFGSVVTSKATVNITAGKLPALFQDLNDKESATSLESLDFSGSIVMKSSNGSRPLLQFTNAKLQAIRLAAGEDRGSRDNSSFSAQLGDRGTVEAKGQLRLQPFSANYATEFANITTGTLLPWLGTSSFTDSIQSTVSGAGEFTFPKNQFNGQVSLAKGSLTGRDPRLSWQKAELNNLHYQASPLRIAVDEVHLDGPRLPLTQNYGELHPLAQLHAYLQSNIAKPLYKAAGKKAAALKIDQFRITDGEIDYADTRLSPVWKGTFSQLNGTVHSISSASSAKPSSFSFSGKLDSVPFTHNGALTVFSAAMNGNSIFSISNLPLPSFHEQLSNQLDIDTSRGLVNVTGTTEWTNGAMDQRSELVFQDVEPLSDLADSALTLALISDEENKFSITAENSQPNSSKPLNLYTDAVLSLKKMIVKASVSPLLLASENYSDLVGNEFADFLPGEIILSGQGRESLSRFSNLLAAHPYIRITLTGLADPEVDGQELKEALEKLENERVAEENRKRSDQLNRETEEYLRKAAEARIAAGETGQVIEDDLPVHLFSKYAPIEPEPVVIDESMLLDLADQRAKVIATFFVENLALDASRIKINHQSRISQNEITPGNRVQFSIEPYNQEKSRQ